MSVVVDKQVLLAQLDRWIGEKKMVAGPVSLRPGFSLYMPLQSSARLSFTGFIHPRNSIKEFVFPKHERICAYRFEGKQLSVEDCPPFEGEQILFAVRPCDAASLPILDKVFAWDSVDPFYARRRAATTVISLACAECDSDCFCASLGLGPDSAKGSDAMLLPLGGERFELRMFTDKGKALLQGLGETSTETAAITTRPNDGLDAGWLRKFMTSDFESPYWDDAGRRCLGCGACAYTCPTCHCFDIVDEGDACQGYRVKNWDNCQATMFTHHASGHNPRNSQGKRQRQRLLHKFRIYPEKFGEVLCTGCGNCSRNCPAGLGIPNTVAALLIDSLHEILRGKS